jgi:hypothetical protein
MAIPVLLGVVGEQSIGIRAQFSLTLEQSDI